MADFSWAKTTPLSRTLVAGHHGADTGAAGIVLTELRDFELVQVMARRGQWDATARAAETRFGTPAPATPQAVRAQGTTLIGSGPGQFLVLAAQGGGALMEASRQAFAGIASLSDQSDGRALLRLSGPKARDMLAKVCSLDLHAAAFPAGSAAATSIDHSSVNFWRGEDAADGGAVFNLLIFSTFAESLWHTLLDSGAEYGIAIDARSFEAPFSTREIAS